MNSAREFVEQIYVGEITRTEAIELCKLRDEQVAREAETKGWQDCLRNVLASVEGYPDHGGDIEIMRAVEKVAREAEREMREAAADICDRVIGCTKENFDCHEIDAANIRALPIDAPGSGQAESYNPFEPPETDAQQNDRIGKMIRGSGELIIADPRSPDGKSVTDGNWEDVCNWAAQSKESK